MRNPILEGPLVAAAAASLLVALASASGCSGGDRPGPLDAAVPDGSVPGAAFVGEPCDADGDCGGGDCIDLPSVEPSCRTGVCTVTCPSWVVDDEGFCLSLTGEVGDCSDLGGRIDGATVCAYASWQATFCE